MGTKKAPTTTPQCRNTTCGGPGLIQGAGTEYVDGFCPSCHAAMKLGHCTIRGEGWACDRDSAPGKGGTTTECQGHYKQRSRKRPYSPLGPPVGERGNLERAQVYIPTELRARALAAADREGVSESEWWRRVGERELESK